MTGMDRCRKKGHVTLVKNGLSLDVQFPQTRLVFALSKNEMSIRPCIVSYMGPYGIVTTILHVRSLASCECILMRSTLRVTSHGIINQPHCTWLKPRMQKHRVIDINELNRSWDLVLYNRAVAQMTTIAANIVIEVWPLLTFPVPKEVTQGSSKLEIIDRSSGNLGNDVAFNSN
ncbi:hypothetical protein HOLleu_17622 [Holothuria leucospilota]|uniref:Uncharacterized protein n=1 Tax=Holothuria leucospilota TaxID=206669 RepID=A0A9Q1C0N0_HOLLE|nr:hypothetical protein HOLleu_17622 [Holothuria leucospilota]